MEHRRRLGAQKSTNYQHTDNNFFHPRMPSRSISHMLGYIFGFYGLIVLVFYFCGLIDEERNKAVPVMKNDPKYDP